MKDTPEDFGGYRELKTSYKGLMGKSEECMSEGRVKVLRRPVQHIYPLEVQSEPSDGELTNMNPPHMQVESPRNSAEPVGTTPDHASKCCPVRASAVQARDRILGCVTD